MRQFVLVFLLDFDNSDKSYIICLALIQPRYLCCEMGGDPGIHTAVFITHGKHDSSDFKLGFLVSMWATLRDTSVHTCDCRVGSV